MPSPNKGEKKKDFLDRCMGDEEANKSFPDSDQRYAFCNSQWDRRDKTTARASEDAPANSGRRIVASNGDILLYGVVGLGLFDPSQSFSAKDVTDVIAALPRNKDITIRLNSGGGVATEGAAIHAALSQHRGTKKVIVEGVAASAASVIAMAGDEVVMQLGATMMIHDPEGITLGSAETHRKTIDQLDAIGNNMAEIYADKTGDTPAAMRALMKKETWMTAQEAVDGGFADTIERGGRKRNPTAFDYRLYRHAPEPLVVMASDRNWQMRPDATSSADQEEEEFDMTEAEKQAAAKKRSDAITQACTLAGKTEKATAYIADAKKSVEDVVAELNTEAVAAAKAKDDAEKAKQTTPQVETVEQITARIQQAEQKRCSDITAACAIAGKSAKAVEFITANKSVTEVLAALAADKTPRTDVSTRHSGAAGSAGSVGGSAADTTAAWGKQAEKFNKRFDAARP